MYIRNEYNLFWQSNKKRLGFNPTGISAKSPTKAANISLKIHI